MRALRLAVLLVMLSGIALVRAQDRVTDLFNRVNTLRISLGLAPYSLNAALTAAANHHAQWMAISGDVSHIQPDGSRPRDRARAAGYDSPWLSENIYAGTNATVDTAWNFWLNSPVHYAGLTNLTYSDMGVGVADGTLHAFVLVFGAPAERVPSRPSASGAASSGSTDGSAESPAGPPAQPSFVVGVDAVGNIMHEVQPGDTLGDIALIYGYSWDVIPTLLAINGMTEADIRTLKQGSVLLVPPWDGTYTPTAEPPTPTAEFSPPPSPTLTPAIVAMAINPAATEYPPLPPPATYVAATSTPPPALIVRTLPPVATAITGRSPGDSLQASSAGQAAPDSRSVLLMAAIIVQAAILALAGLELIRRRS